MKLDKSFDKLIEYVGNLEYHEIERLIAKPESPDLYKMVQTENSTPAGSMQVEFKRA